MCSYGQLREKIIMEIFSHNSQEKNKRKLENDVYPYIAQQINLTTGKPLTSSYITWTHLNMFGPRPISMHPTMHVNILLSNTVASNM